MDPYSFTNITTAVVAGLTVWMLIARLRGVIESNWPVAYYLGLVVYSVVFPGYLDPAWVYSGVVCGLLLRFEFMGGIFLTLMRLVEGVVLILLLYGLASNLYF